MNIPNHPEQEHLYQWNASSTYIRAPRYMQVNRQCINGVIPLRKCSINTKTVQIYFQIFFSISFLFSSLTHLKPVEGTRFAQLDILNISENPLDCNCTVKGLIVAGLDPLKIICYTHKNDLEANFILSAHSLFGDASCLTPFTIKLVFMVGLILILGLFFTVSLTIQVSN